MSGIYAITSPSGRQYIGSTRNFANRWKSHRSVLRNGKHHSRRLQAACDKYGLDRLIFRVLLVCRSEDLTLYEQLSFTALRPVYNVASTALLGVVHTEAAKALMSATRKGRKMPPRTDEQIARYRAGSLGKTRSSESCAKQSSSARGQKRQQPFSDTHKAAISAAKRGKKMTPEAVAIKIAWQTGSKASPKRRAAIAAALTGKPHSPERRAAISAGRLEASLKRRLRFRESNHPDDIA